MTTERPGKAKPQGILDAMSADDDTANHHRAHRQGGATEPRTSGPIFERRKESSMLDRALLAAIILLIGFLCVQDSFPVIVSPSGWPPEPAQESVAWRHGNA